MSERYHQLLAGESTTQLNIWEIPSQLSMGKKSWIFLENMPVDYRQLDREVWMKAGVEGGGEGRENVKMGKGLNDGGRYRGQISESSFCQTGKEKI